jgi:ubiquinone/menaquinone biosynthesis C-methylase UbiE
MDKSPAEARTQLDFYARQARSHVEIPFGRGEADYAVPFIVGQLRMRNWRSLLDVGAGSGRLMALIAQQAPLERLVGLEPSADLRMLAQRDYGFARDAMIDGDATALPFADGEFDVVTEFAVLHHLRQPRRAVREMIRVARHAVMIVDGNNFGQGSYLARRCKQALNALRLWPAVDFLRTRGKRYHVTEGDGLWYSYSAFSDIDLLRDRFETVHVVNGAGSSTDHYRDAPGVLILAIGKKP